MSVTFSVESADFEDFDDPRHYNVANGSAARLLRALGLPENLYGELEPNDLIRRLATVDPAAHVEAPLTERVERVKLDENGVGVDHGPTIHFAGIDEDRVTRWVEGLRRVAKLAAEAGVSVTYA